MSAITVRILTCDGTISGEVCPEEYGGELNVSASILRIRAREEGWRSGGGRDVCPSTDHDEPVPATDLKSRIAELAGSPDDFWGDGPGPATLAQRRQAGFGASVASGLHPVTAQEAAWLPPARRRPEPIDVAGLAQPLPAPEAVTG